MRSFRVIPDADSDDYVSINTTKEASMLLYLKVGQRVFMPCGSSKSEIAAFRAKANYYQTKRGNVRLNSRMRVRASDGVHGAMVECRPAP